MEEKKLIGRHRECKSLQKCLKSNSAELVVVYGRRRVGKTFLINQFFKGRFDFKVTGLYNEPKEAQTKAFMTELNSQSQKRKPLTRRLAGCIHTSKKLSVKSRIR